MAVSVKNNFTIHPEELSNLEADRVQMRRENILGSIAFGISNLEMYFEEYSAYDIEFVVSSRKPKDVFISIRKCPWWLYPKIRYELGRFMKWWTN